MKILTQYIIKEFLVPFFYCTLTLFLIYLIADLFEHMDEFLSAGMTLFQMAKYYFFMLPIIFVQIAPFSFVLSLIFELGLFAKHNEVVAMKVSGISPKKIAFPLVIMGFILSCFVLFCDQYVIPLSQAKLNLYDQHQEKKEAQSDIYTDLTFYNIENQYVFHIQEIKGISAQGLQVHHLRDDGTLKGCYRARTAQWLDESWWFFDGSYIRYNDDGNIIAPSEFYDKKIMPYKESPQRLIQHKDSPEMNFYEYKHFLNAQFGKDIPPAKIVDLHFKLSNSVACFILGLLVIPFGLRITRSGSFSALGKTLLITFGFYGIGTLFIVMGKQEALFPIVAVWSTPILFGTVGIYQMISLR